MLWNPTILCNARTGESFARAYATLVHTASQRSYLIARNCTSFCIWPPITEPRYRKLRTAHWAQRRGRGNYSRKEKQISEDKRRNKSLSCASRNVPSDRYLLDVSQELAPTIGIQCHKQLPYLICTSGFFVGHRMSEQSGLRGFMDNRKVK